MCGKMGSLLSAFAFAGLTTGLLSCTGQRFALKSGLLSAVTASSIVLKSPNFFLLNVRIPSSPSTAR